MNNRLGRIGSLIAAITVLLFAACMLLDFSFGSYLVCIFLSFGFVLMISAFKEECAPDRRALAGAAMAFAAVYCALILLVYFAQITSVRLDGLNAQAMRIMDYTSFGLFFNYDLLGYGLMALSTFFVGWTIEANNRTDRWLKWLLILHGVFFPPCLLMPMLGIFSTQPENGYRAGVIALECWCAYFLPVSVLAYRHFRHNGR
ncbi:MAG: hypothetical protein Q4C13_06210 [Clostridia bacterium]|nr:hypothetical protein [Clostridia bacterium]